MTAKDMLRKVVPTSWRPVLRGAYTRVVHAGFRRQCNICGAWLQRFLAHGIPPEPDFLCPICLSKPPHRLTSEYFDRHPDLFAAGRNMLHVAPEPGLGARLKARCRALGMAYRAGGLNSAGDAHIDLRKLDIPSASMDLVYCCHVLNAMHEDAVAMRELHRVLKQGGLALLQVPAFESGPSTVEPADAAGRLRVFGDELIFRRYTNEDYRRRLRAAGFAVDEFRARDLSPGLVERLQLKAEVVHLCTKD
jgi:SAM-dependent methyltransferase